MGRPTMRAENCFRKLKIRRGMVRGGMVRDGAGAVREAERFRETIGAEPMKSEINGIDVFGAGRQAERPDVT
jgi:hypothetical protein